MSTKGSRVYAERNANTCRVQDCREIYYGNGFCKKHHQWHWARGLIKAPDVVTLKEKIIKNSVLREGKECWEWSGHKNNRGYGTVWCAVRGKIYAHRAAYLEFKGPIGKWMVVRHKCDNPCCVNPDHLEIGTQKQNMQDSVMRGRNKVPNLPSGVHHPMAALSAEHVRYIRSSVAPSTVLAKKFGVHKKTISMCREKNTYMDVL